MAEAARSFRVYYRRVPLEGGGYTMDHSASVFLIDGAGRFAGTLLSGLLYAWAGLGACLVGSALMLAACWALTLALPTLAVPTRATA